MKKLISLFIAMCITLCAYSKEPEYTCVGKQFNAVVINVPASFVIEKGNEHSVNVINLSNEFYDYKIVEDTLFIKSKYLLDVNTMDSKKLKVTLTHPSPSKLYHNIVPTGRELIKAKSGNQK